MVEAEDAGAWTTAWLPLLLAGGLACPAAMAQAPSPSACEEFRREPIQFFFQQKPDAAIACGNSLLEDENLSPVLRNEVLTTLGTIHLAQGRARLAEASFLEMLSADPAVELPFASCVPRRVQEFFVSLQDSVLGGLPAGGITSIAIGDIENNSFVESELDLDRFTQGLRHVLLSDFLGATPLKVVDRQRLDVIRQEIGMSRDEEIMDPRYRVRLGKLSGAQSYLFGSFMLMDKNSIRLDFRWVDTATGEVLLAEGKTGKFRATEDLFALERAILTELLLPQVRAMLGDEAPGDMNQKVEKLLEDRRRALQGNGEYLQLLLEAGEALLAESSEEDEVAVESWTQVSRLDPTDEYASSRVLGLRAFQEMAVSR